MQNRLYTCVCLAVLRSIWKYWCYLGILFRKNLSSIEFISYCSSIYFILNWTFIVHCFIMNLPIILPLNFFKSLRWFLYTRSFTSVFRFISSMNGIRLFSILIHFNFDIVFRPSEIFVQYHILKIFTFHFYKLLLLPILFNFLTFSLSVRNLLLWVLATWSTFCL